MVFDQLCVPIIAFLNGNREVTTKPKERDVTVMPPATHRWRWLVRSNTETWLVSAARQQRAATKHGRMWASQRPAIKTRHCKKFSLAWSGWRVAGAWIWLPVGRQIAFGDMFQRAPHGVNDSSLNTFLLWLWVKSLQPTKMGLMSRHPKSQFCGFEGYSPNSLSFDPCPRQIVSVYFDCAETCVVISDCLKRDPALSTSLVDHGGSFFCAFHLVVISLLEFHTAAENGPFIDDPHLKNWEFSVTMSKYQWV